MLQGLSVSPGVAVGRAVIVRFGRLPAFRRAVAPEEFEREEKRFRRAAARAGEELARHSRDAQGDMGSELAAILEAHSLIAADETYLRAVVERVRRERVNAEWALAEVTRELGERLAAADSAAMREREADIADVGPRDRGAALGRRTIRMGRASAGFDPRGRRALAGRGGAPGSAPRPSPRPRARRSDLACLDHRAFLRAARRRRHTGSVPGRFPGAPDPRRRRPRRGRSAPLPSAHPPRVFFGRGKTATAAAGAVSGPHVRAVTSDGVAVAVRANLELPEETTGARAVLRRGRRALPLRVSLPPGAAAVSRHRGAARGLRDAARGGRAASGRRADLRSRRREGDRAGPGGEPRAGAPGHPLLPRPSRALRRTAHGALPRRRGKAS